MAAVCTAAMAFGRWPERFGAAVIASDWIASAFVQDRRWHHHGQPITFGLDLVMLGLFAGLAVGCRRVWVLWGAACVLLLDATHTMVLLDPQIGQWSYITAIYTWELSLLLSLAMGAALEGRRPAGPLWLGRRTRAS